VASPDIGAPASQRVGGNVSQAELIFSPKPIYFDSLRSSGIQVQTVIGKDGSVIKSRVISSGAPGLTDAALDAVKQ
jgi:outer membrane biosynthesis protein TonB